jgi:hypothetical protein
MGDMDLSEILISENIDEILMRWALRLEQKRIDLEALPDGSLQSIAAGAALTSSVASFDRLKSYRARLQGAPQGLQRELTARSNALVRA